MTNVKRLRSVIFSTAHHAMSGLSYIHPHLGEACKEIRRKSITVNLLIFDFEPELLTITRELELSTEALIEKFHQLLLVEHIEVSDMEATSIKFYFLQDIWPASCNIEAFTDEGKRVEVAVGLSGHKTEILYSNG